MPRSQSMDGVPLPLPRAQLLSESVRESMDKHSIVGTRATQGAAWVRGWDDIRKDSEAEPQQQ